MQVPFYKKLYRSRNERMIAGVCGGLAEHFEIDPVWVRLLFIFFFFAGGAAFLLYVVLWVIVPVEPYISRSKRKISRNDN